MNIYSKINNRLLHIVHYKDDFKDGRKDLILPDNFLQCSTMRLEKGKTFKPHRHISRTRTLDIYAQEVWIIVKGKVKCFYYDIDDTLMQVAIIGQGDMSVTLAGGHTFEILEDGSEVIEIKSGPYEGQSLDKVFIDD